MTTVLPCDLHAAMTSRSSSIASRSRFEVGSSRTISSGSIAATPAQAIFCFSPPERLKMLRPSSPSILISETVLSMRRRISASGSPIFSHPKASSAVVSTQKN